MISFKLFINAFLFYYNEKLIESSSHNAKAESMLIISGLEKNDFHGIFIFSYEMKENITLIGRDSFLNKFLLSFTLLIWIYPDQMPTLRLFVSIYYVNSPMTSLRILYNSFSNMRPNIKVNLNKLTINFITLVLCQKFILARENKNF